MPIAKHLLSRAYALASTGKTRDACLVLDVVVRQEPNHIEAWEFYLQASTGNRSQVEALGARIAASKDMLPQIKQEVLEYYNYLLRRLDGRERARAQRRQFLLRLGFGIALGVMIFILREQVSLTVSLGLLVGLAAALLLADWIRRNGRTFIPSRRALVRSYAQEAALVEIEENKIRLVDRAEASAQPGVRRKRKSSAGRRAVKAVTAARPKVTVKVSSRTGAAPIKSAPHRKNRVKLK